VVILGDRYEMLSVASASLMLQIPIAHIHGGEITEGAIDDALRHAITKLSHLHFASTQMYADRIVQMGEEPNRVFNVGSLGVESIKTLRLLSHEEFEKSIKFKLHKKNILVTYHPQTLSKLSAKEQMQELLTAFDELKETAIIFTKANADEGGKVINAMIDEYVKENSDRAVAFESLGQLRYFSAIKYVDAVVGNSSSGILEVPSFHKPTVNIGDRQKGRVQAKSIINCKIDSKEITEALKQVYDKNFQVLLKKTHSPYESENTSQKIKEIIKKSSFETIFYKSFYDIKGTRYE
jgi:GDP/UDP-N,N'-diacetylbacillosamine 2-epimerase (hydrolysing)